MNNDGIRNFFRIYEASAVGATPVQPNIGVGESEDDDDEKNHQVDLRIEQEKWSPILLGEAPAREGEFPRRFIDGSHQSQPVLSVRSPQGYPIALVLSEIGAVALHNKGRKFEREYVTMERVLSFVADPFPWKDVEAFASDLMNREELQLRVLPANMPDLTQYSPFDYEAMRTQARSRSQWEMAVLERIAFESDTQTTTLVDGPLHRVMGQMRGDEPLRVGVIKSQTGQYLDDDGYRTLLDLKPSYRTPCFKFEGRRGDGGSLPVVSWYLKISGGPNLAPNWGYVRVEVPWSQFSTQFRGDFNFITRLSRWIIDARCRTSSYSRMPVSLEPIVRAEECLKPLFTPMQVLVNRLYRSAGLFRRNEG